MKRALVLAGIGLSVSLFGLSVATRMADAADSTKRHGAVDRRDALVELGRRLFFDPAIGRAGRVSCAACHDPEHGFSDSRAQSVDETGPLPRHSQPVTDLGGRGFHWDGEFDTVREIVEARVLPRGTVAANAVDRIVARAEAAQSAGVAWDHARLRERTKAAAVPVYYGSMQTDVAAAPDESPVESRLAARGLYADGFTAAFGSPLPTAERVVDAVDAYVRSLRTADGPVDRFLAGDSEALSPAARRGHALFVGKAACAQCHVATAAAKRRALFTDGTFHDTGIGWDAKKSALGDLGAGSTTLVPRHDGKFKTPSLRDVARRAPYMHDGRFSTLAEVVAYYDAGATPHAGLDARIRPLSLKPDESSDLVAFLESLSGDERAGLGVAAPNRPKRLRVRVVDVAGSPMPGVSVVVTAAGDRLRESTGADAPTSALTDAQGAAVFTWPATTHVAVVSDVAETAPLPLVPDWTTSVEIVALRFDESRPTLAIPTDVCEGRDAVRATPCAPGPPRAPVTLSLVRRMANGKSVYVADAPLATIEGRYELSTLDAGRTIGTYELRNWGAVPRDLQPAAAPAPREFVVVSDSVRARVRRLLPSDD